MEEMIMTKINELVEYVEKTAYKQGFKDGREYEATLHYWGDQGKEKKDGDL